MIPMEIVAMVLRAMYPRDVTGWRDKGDIEDVECVRGFELELGEGCVLIAEDMSAMPGMCHTHEGYGALNYLDTDYINLIAGSVQEHTDEITHLKNRVAMLEAEVTRLRRGLAA